MPTQLEDPHANDQRDDGQDAKDDASPIASVSGRATALVLGLVLVVGALVAASWWWAVSAGTTEEFTATYEDVNTVMLSLREGSVNITPAEGDVVTMHEEVETTLRPIDTFQQVHDDGTLELSSDSCGTVIFAFFNQCSVTYTLRVPDDVSVVGSTRHGHIDITGLTGDIDVSSSHGRLNFEDISGDIAAHSDHGAIDLNRISGVTDVETNHGRITAHNLNGPMTAASAHGRIELSGGNADTIDLNTTHGRIEVLDIASERIDAATGHGNVRVEPATHPQHIEVLSSHGSIDINLPTDPPAYAVTTATGHGSENIELPTDPSAEYHLAAETDHGSITIGMQP